MFDSPDAPRAPETGDRFSAKAHVGRLVAIRVDKYEPSVKTSRGDKPAVGCQVTVIDGPEAGRVYPDVLLFGVVLTQQLQAKVGRSILGRLINGEDRDGNVPVILEPATAAETEQAVRLMTGAPSPAAQRICQQHLKASASHTPCQSALKGMMAVITPRTIPCECRRDEPSDPEA